jgi:hypothetical protein
MTYYSPQTLKSLFSLAGNECAYPGCANPVFDTTVGTLTGQICHIKGKSKGGPRYDVTQSEKERNGYPNLLVMCGAHNTIVDDPNNIEQYPVEVLQKYKSDHESRSHNSTVKEDVVARLVASLAQLISGRPEVALTPVVTSLMAGPNNDMRFDYYDFRVEFRNDGETTVRDFRLEVKIPKPYASPQSCEADAGENDETKSYRRTQEGFPGFVLYPDQTKLVLSLTYVLAWDQYADVEGDIVVTIYSDDRRLGRTSYPIRNYRNQDRLNMLGLT